MLVSVVLARISLVVCEVEYLLVCVRAILISFVTRPPKTRFLSFSVTEMNTDLGSKQADGVYRRQLYTGSRQFRGMSAPLLEGVVQGLINAGSGEEAGEKWH